MDETYRCGHPRTAENSRRTGVGKSAVCLQCNREYHRRYARARYGHRPRELDAIEFRCGHPRDLWNTMSSATQTRCRTCREEQLRRTAPKQPDPEASFECGHPRNPENCLRAGAYLQCRTCSRAWMRRRRRHMGLGDVIPLADLIRRDGARCYLCRVAVLLGAPNSDPRQATIEHVVPISRGGTHTWGNVRVACRACNSAKGARLVA